MKRRLVLLNKGRTEVGIAVIPSPRATLVGKERVTKLGVFLNTV